VRLAIFGNPDSWHVADLTRAAHGRGHEVTHADFRTLRASIADRRQAVHSRDARLTSCDAVIVRTMPPGTLEQVVFRMDALLQLERSGVTLVNAPKAMECAVDKYLSVARMQQSGLPVPDSVVCETTEDAMRAFDDLGGDVVLKPVFGSEGRGICRISDRDLAFRSFRTLERIGSVLFLQRFIEHEGFDVRVLVLDGEILGGMRRVSESDFRTNVARSARPEPWTPTDAEADLAKRAASAVGARFAGVDLLYHRSGAVSVIEANAVPGWRAFLRVNQIDVAARVMESLERNR
jgi:ribosomal protein S6--L-glutamate ligase